ncbi:MAG TPA: phosphate signaling complex protein PhoU [Candidatus Cryosericum sp.]|nr:phosphate signaling complex protein PhoU [Candidatus Cryosericum sp.]HPS70462.1 phosphate signaling complex protein PhoU [Candidatus Cryosericum sp.]
MNEEKLQELKDKLFAFSALASSMIDKSVRAIVAKDPALARQVIEVDELAANEYDHAIERETINFIALYQPEARMLRSVYMYAKIGSDLERLADHAVNIAESAEYLIERPDIKPYVDIPRMSEQSQTMLADAMTAFSTQNTGLALDVVERDDTVDSLSQQVLRELLTYMMADPTTIDRALQILRVAGNLERVADLATNIAEDVVFTTTGRLIRHNRLSREELDQLRAQQH